MNGNYLSHDNEEKYLEGAVIDSEQWLASKEIA